MIAQTKRCGAPPRLKSMGEKLVPLLFLGSAAFAQVWSVGVKGGVPFTGAFSDVTTIGSRTFSQSKQYIVGPMVELQLPLGFSAEVDAFYRPLNSAFQFTVQQNPFTYAHNISSWEFPILGKFRLPFPVVKPKIGRA